MENFYETLDVPMEADHKTVKHAFQKLALKYHPDKQSNADAASDVDSNSQYLKIQKAWDILGDPDTRKEYDARWKQHCMAQDWPVQDDVDIDDFDYDEDSKSYTYDCRCGGVYELSELDVSFKMDYVGCDICSLCIKVVYSDAEENDYDDNKSSNYPDHE